MGELTCPVRVRDPLPDGEQTIFRPRRSEAGRRTRRFSPTDAGRVANRAACDHGVRVVSCQVLKGLGLAEDVRALIGRIEGVEELIVGRPGLPGQIDAVVEKAILVLARILELIKRSRVLRWILRRLFALQLILEGLARAGELLEVLRVAAGVLADAREQLEAMACPKSEVEE